MAMIVTPIKTSLALDKTWIRGYTIHVGYIQHG
jgi:hypothetical protein